MARKKRRGKSKSMAKRRGGGKINVKRMRRPGRIGLRL